MVYLFIFIFLIYIFLIFLHMSLHNYVTCQNDSTWLLYLTLVSI